MLSAERKLDMAALQKSPKSKARGLPEKVFMILNNLTDTTLYEENVSDNLTYTTLYEKNVSDNLTYTNLYDKHVSPGSPDTCGTPAL
jgi:hypothetical protein